MTELEQLRAERDTLLARIGRIQGEAADVGKALRDMTAERDHLKSREQSIIAACERVADGGQYRADIVSAIQTIRQQRDERGDLLRRMVADHDMRARAIGTCGVDPLIEAAREMLK